MRTTNPTDTDAVRERANAVRARIRRFQDVPRIDVDRLAKDVAQLADEVDVLRAKLEQPTD